MLTPVPLSCPYNSCFLATPLDVIHRLKTTPLSDDAGKSGYYFHYALHVDISEGNIVEEFVNNSQSKRCHVNALELFKKAFETGEFYLPRKNSDDRKSQILTITHLCLVCIDMKKHEYLNMTELICMQTETVLIRRKQKTKNIGDIDFCFLEMICCVTFMKVTERELAGEDRETNDGVKFLILFLGWHLNKFDIGSWQFELFDWRNWYYALQLLSQWWFVVSKLSDYTNIFVFL